MELLKPFRPDQGIDEIDQKAKSDGTAQNEIERHGYNLSQRLVKPARRAKDPKPSASMRISSMKASPS